MQSMYKPERLTQDLLIQHVGDETLIYDEGRHLAFCLNRLSSAVWQRCDGIYTPAQIATALETEMAQPVTEDDVLTALEQMQGNGLIKPAPTAAKEVAPVPASLFSRRELMTKLAVGTAVAAPFIAVIAAPPATVAAYDGEVHSG